MSDCPAPGLPFVRDPLASGGPVPVPLASSTLLSVSSFAGLDFDAGGAPACRLDVVTTAGVASNELSPQTLIELGLDFIATALRGDCDSALYCELTEAHALTRDEAFAFVLSVRDRRQAADEERAREMTGEPPPAPAEAEPEPPPAEPEPPPGGAGPGTNTGHGHVWSRPDGMVARCGGPGLCSKCSAAALSWPKAGGEGQ